MNKKNLVILLFVGVLMVSFVSAGWFTGYTLKEGKAQFIEDVNLDVKITNIDREGVVSVDIKNPETGKVETIKTAGGSVTTPSGMQVDVSNIKKSRFLKRASAIVAVDSKQYKKQACTDSDVSFLYPNGINPEVQGVVIHTVAGTYGDYCQDSNLVYEYACNSKGQVTGQTLNCPNGCWNGVCNSQPFPSNVTNQTNVSTYPIPSNVTNQTLHNHLVDREIRTMQFEIDSASYGLALNLSGSNWMTNLPGYNTNIPGNKAQIAIFNIGGKKMLRTQALVSCGPGEVATGGGYNIGAANPTVVGAIPQQGDYNVVMNAPLNSIISGAEGWGIEIFEPYTDTNNDGLDDEGASGGWVYTICAKIESSQDQMTAHFP